MQAPLVSVVIPAYNAARTVGATIQSALAQTIADLEVIVVDDGSRDDTAAVVESVSDPRLKLLRQDNAGAAAARNTGIRASRGKYVAFLDSDDLWLTYKLERQLAVLESEPGVHAVQSGAVFVNDAFQVVRLFPCLPSRDPLLDALSIRNAPNAMSTFIVERSMFDVMGYFDIGIEILEDLDIYIRCVRYCNLRSIEEPLSIYRVHPGNRSRDVGIHIEPGMRILNRTFSDPTLPPRIRAKKRLIYARMYTMFCAAWVNAGRWGEGGKWGLKAITTHPSAALYIATMPLRRFRRWRAAKVIDGQLLAFLRRQAGGPPGDVALA